METDLQKGVSMANLSELNIIGEFETWIKATQALANEVQRLQQDLRDRYSPSPPIHSDTLSFTMTNAEITCNGIPLKLKNKPLTFKLIAAFVNHELMAISKSDLMNLVYNQSDYEDRSDRFKLAMQQNLIKLISRSRKLMATAIQPIYQGKVDWFWYDGLRETWHFYRLREQGLPNLVLSEGRFEHTSL
jgi:hypothetical protein